MNSNGPTDQTTFVPLNLKRRAGRLITDTGVYDSRSDTAKVECVAPSTVNRLVRMGLLAPDLIEELMAGKKNPD